MAAVMDVSAARYLPGLEILLVHNNYFLESGIIINYLFYYRNNHYITKYLPTLVFSHQLVEVEQYDHAEHVLKCVYPCLLIDCSLLLSMKGLLQQYSNLMTAHPVSISVTYP